MIQMQLILMVLIKRTVKDVNGAINGVNVNFCKIRKSGTVAIGFNDAASKNIAKEKIQKCSELSDAFTVKSPKKLLPKVTLSGINEVLFDSCGTEDRDAMKSILLKDILARNDNIKQLVDSDSNETLEVVMIQKYMPSHSVAKYSAAVKMSSAIRKAIHENGDKLYVSLSRCSVVDRYHILQCYHCQKPGHHSKNCPKKEDLPTCLYCSGPHKSKACPDKSKTCCSNCKNSKNAQWKSNACSHNAASIECPVLKSHREGLMNKTENWSGKK